MMGWGPDPNMMGPMGGAYNPMMFGNGADQYGSVGQFGMNPPGSGNMIAQPDIYNQQ